MFPSIKYSSSTQSGDFTLLQLLPGHLLITRSPEHNLFQFLLIFSGQVWSLWTKWDERMLIKQYIDRKHHHNPLTSWTERNPDSPWPPPMFPPWAARRPSPSRGPQVPRVPRLPGGCAPLAPRRPGRGAAPALTSARHVWAGQPRGWRRNPAGKAAGKAAGPRGAPERACCSPRQQEAAGARLGHSAAQAVAPVRAVSCEAAPRLGVTASPAAQSRRKASPSSAAVIAAGPAGTRLLNAGTCFSQKDPKE